MKFSEFLHQHSLVIVFNGRTWDLEDEMADTVKCGRRLVSGLESIERIVQMIGSRKIKFHFNKRVIEVPVLENDVSG